VGDSKLIARTKRGIELIWYSRSRLGFLNVPIPWRLPYGGWFLAFGDSMGARVCGYRLAEHPYEEGPWHFVWRFLQPGMTFVDVGANQGFYTILASKLVGTDGLVVAFEPASTESRKLRWNLHINSCRNVRLEEAAVGSFEGNCDFHMCLAHQGSFSSIRHPASDVTSKTQLVHVPITTLDACASRFLRRQVDLVKIDVEGGELDVLRGAKQMFSSTRPLVMCEVEDRRTETWGYRAVEIIYSLRSVGYRWCTVDAKGNLESLPPRREYASDNLVAVPEEKTVVLKGKGLLC